jgi:hypothetical protein
MQRDFSFYGKRANAKLPSESAATAEMSKMPFQKSGNR